MSNTAKNIAYINKSGQTYQIQPVFRHIAAVPLQDGTYNITIYPNQYNYVSISQESHWRTFKISLSPISIINSKNSYNNEQNNTVFQWYALEFIANDYSTIIFNNATDLVFADNMIFFPNKTYQIYIINNVVTCIEK